MARERPHDAGGAENRQAAENAEARVHRFQCECFAAFDADRHFEAAGVSMFRRELGQMFGHHLAWYWIDRWFADGQREAGARHRPDAWSRTEYHTRFGAQPHAGEYDRAVRHVGIVACVFYRACFRAVGGQAAEHQWHRHMLALRQHDLRDLADDTHKQQTRGRERRRGGATAGRVAATQRRGSFGRFFAHYGWGGESAELVDVLDVALLLEAPFVLFVP